MASSLRNPEDKEPFKVQLVIKKVKQPEFNPIPKFSYKRDVAGALSIILPKFVMVEDVRKCYNFEIGWIGEIEIRKAYKNLCDNDMLKEEFNIVEKKDLLVP